ncbi:GAF domain-containing protein [Jiangella rhizosphaerae]|uniref:GAF domain-containing protein n=1 Tax=Jiangella rhizosphaerae TaxID=2293569 RepID=A0A418KUB0_9ACTN|nr:GAF domain-containing protein [Jiangella rhizosphaerae]RIQ31142.1 GAF domain-containing protein [Jiangella rhizosphaerae]
MTKTAMAWSAGADLPAIARRLRFAHETFVTTGRAAPGVRPVVADSWQRSVSSGADPAGARLPPVELTDADLDGYRSGHPLAAVMPVIRNLLVADAADSDLLVAVADHEGRLLWVEGEPVLRRRAEAMHFLAGARWSEQAAGTNAPGTALAIGGPVQIFAAEHFSAAVQPWSCSAAPIHDPRTGAVLGVIDVTGGDHVASPHMLTLVRAAAAAAEGELRLQALRPPAPSRSHPAAPPAARPRLEVLGTTGRLLCDGAPRTISPRLAEVLLLLTLRPDGLTAEQLAVDLYEREPSMVTVRAELSRLRALLGTDALGSRPYRLHVPVATDLAELDALLARGDARAAVDRYTGPVLPFSQAPRIARLRAETAAALRRVLLDHADGGTLLDFAQRHADDDLEVWTAAHDRLPAGDPRRSTVGSRIDLLDAELGLS